MTFFYHEDDPCCTRPKREQPLQDAACLPWLVPACARPKVSSKNQRFQFLQTKNKRQTKFTKPIQLKIATFFNFLQRSFSAGAAASGAGGGGVRRRGRQRQAQGAATATQQRSLARRQERSERNRSQGRNRTGAWDSRGVFLQKV